MVQSKTNPILTGNERVLPSDDIIVSKTDLTGRITYGNRTFYDFAGLTESDCLGVQHNLIRHPDMPRAVFELLWKTIASGHEIFAYVLNRSANGDAYWVFAHVTPSRDTRGEITGYHSNRRSPDRALIDRHILPLYQNLLQIEQRESRPKDGLRASFQAVTDLLDQQKSTFNQFMFALET